jgi:hypothetical protein
MCRAPTEDKIDDMMDMEIHSELVFLSVFSIISKIFPMI